MSLCFGGEGEGESVSVHEARGREILGWWIGDGDWDWEVEGAGDRIEGGVMGGRRERREEVHCLVLWLYFKRKV